MKILVGIKQACKPRSYVSIETLLIDQPTDLDTRTNSVAKKCQVGLDTLDPIEFFS